HALAAICEQNHAKHNMLTAHNLGKDNTCTAELLWTLETTSYFENIQRSRSKTSPRLRQRASKFHPAHKRWHIQISFLIIRSSRQRTYRLLDGGFLGNRWCANSVTKV